MVRGFAHYTFLPPGSQPKPQPVVPNPPWAILPSAHALQRHGVATALCQVLHKLSIKA